MRLPVDMLVEVDRVARETGRTRNEIMQSGIMEVRVIDSIQKGIFLVSQKEAPYDIFICCKEADENGNRTIDSVLADEIYYQLTKEEYRVFFARITLQDKPGADGHCAGNHSCFNICNIRRFA